MENTAKLWTDTQKQNHCLNISALPGVQSHSSVAKADEQGHKDEQKLTSLAQRVKKTLQRDGFGITWNKILKNFVQHLKKLCTKVLYNFKEIRMKNEKKNEIRNKSRGKQEKEKK